MLDWDSVPNSGGYIVEYKTNAMPGYRTKEAKLSSISLHIANELGGQTQSVSVRIYGKGQEEYPTSPPATQTYANP